jgi:hypothetical protein
MATSNKIYWDDQRQCWMVDDHGWPRQATSEEIEQQVEQWEQQQQQQPKQDIDPNQQP